MDLSLKAKGWVELEGRRLGESDVRAILLQNPGAISRFGGEFFLEWNGCKARDHFGIMPGDCPPGAVVCSGKELGRVDPNYPLMDLDEAIRIAVQLRSDEGVVALSGGVDSALVARLAGRECVVVGIAGSHDLLHASQVAEEFGLTLHQVIIDPASIEEALAQVLAVIPKKDPVNASIATTLYFVSQWAGQHGEARILAGQGADELFGGYSRYLQTETLAAGSGEGFPGTSPAAGQRSGRGRAAWRILLLALHGLEGSSSCQGYSAGNAGAGWGTQETAASCCRKAYAAGNCPI